MAGEPDDDVVTTRGLTEFQRTILLVLAEGPRYGLAIRSALEEYYGSEINHGRVYQNLDDLADMGLIAKQALDDRTNEYSLTDTGETAIRDRLHWALEQYVTTPERERELRGALETRPRDDSR